MIRRLAAAAALLLAAPAQAQDLPDWVGVWEGTIGTLPVRACLDVFGADGPGHGAYYYLSRLEPIALNEEEGWEGGWTERAAGSDETAFWEMNDFDGRRIRGTWYQGRRELPIALDPVAWSEGEWGGPCSSAAFLAARVGGGDVRGEPAELDGWRYTRQSYRPAAHFADEVSIESFAFAPEQPGDAAILARLAGALPRESLDDEFVQCLAGAIAMLGTDGSFEQAVRPTLATEAFLVLEETSATFCGGAHPNYWTAHRTFDRRTGEEVDLTGWLASSEGGAGLPAALRALILTRWPEDTADCREHAETAEYWSLGLARDGLIFRPDFPHALTPCEEPVTLDWDTLVPFLNEQGRAGRARL